MNNKIKELENNIKFHRNLYYNEQSEISDAEYDVLESKLKKLDPNNPLFSEVGKDSDIRLKKIQHIIPMGSLSKASNSEEFYKWAKKMNYDLFIIQFKLDGISVELQYINGKFKYGVSRGNGLIGDNISENVKKMKGFISKVNFEFSGAVRGEIILTKDIFKSKYSNAKNSRNMASGIVKRKDGKGSEDLTIITYDVNSNYKFKDELKKIEWMKNYFNVVTTKVFNSMEEIVNYRNEILILKRKEFNFDINGLVIKGKEIDLNDMKRARPMKQIAFKFNAEEVKSIIIDVEWSESGSNYTPIAIIEPILIAGTTVSRASLANPNLIKELNLKIGSEVIVSKRGDIIPKIERVIYNPSNAREIITPKICEICSTKLLNEGTRLYCPNVKCPKRNYHRLLKWIKKLDVKNFGELILKQLFDQGKVEEIADLYKLNVSDLIKLERVGEKSARKSLDNLFAVKEVSLAKFIGGFDLENIGERMCEKVVRSGHDMLEKIYDMNIEDFLKIESFGDITANKFYSEFHALHHEMINLLKIGKIKIKELINKMGKLDGMSFCFTGKLENIKRTEANNIVLTNGGTPKNSVTKNLTYLVTNSMNQTGKYLKAQKQQGTEIITEKEFLEMINE